MSTQVPFGLPPATLHRFGCVFARHGAIDSVLIYGSRAKGNHRSGSDIDLVIKGARSRSLNSCRLRIRLTT